MRVVSPYRHFTPESTEHLELGPFDWPGALRMLAASVRQSCHLETVALTDAETVLPVPAFRYPVRQSRLMLWILDVSLAYLSSPDFDTDTILISPDTLIFGDLRSYFDGDLTILTRSARYAGRPILNAVQWWPVKSQKKLVEFYTEALAIALSLSEDYQKWGADTEPIRRLVEPITQGIHLRQGLKIRMLDAAAVFQSLSSTAIAQLQHGHPVQRPLRPILDFKYTRKRYMARYFEATFGQAVPA